MKPFFYIANWKMNQSLAQAEVFVQALQNDSTMNSLPTTTRLVLCPSFPHLGLLTPKLQKTSAALGAQTCSPHDAGPYTGQVSARMLADVGCTYCVIGHSERRSLGNETDEHVAQQYQQLVHNGITPIVCIGESEAAYAAGTTTAVLEQQLASLIKAYQETPAPTLLIAYEPIWAIGTGKTPSETELSTIFTWLNSHLESRLLQANQPQASLQPQADLNNRDQSQPNLPQASLPQKYLTNPPIFLVYGGSVQPENNIKLKKVDHLDGLLIGNASLDFKNFKNIVL